MLQQNVNVLLTFNQSGHSKSKKNNKKKFKTRCDTCFDEQKQKRNENSDLP